MKDKITLLGKRYLSTPIIHEQLPFYKEFKRIKEENKKKQEKKKIIYSKPSYDHMYARLPLKPYLN